MIPSVAFSLYGPFYIHSFVTLLSHSFHVTGWPFTVDTAKWLWIHWHYSQSCGPGSVVGIVTGYRLDSPGIKSQWGARFSAPVQTGPGDHPASCTMGTGSFPGVKSGWGVTLTPHLLPVPWSWKSRAIPLLPLWAVRLVQSLSACTRVTFTLHFLSSN